MPVIIISTNLPRTAIPDNFLEDVTDLAIKMLQKPKKYFCVQVKPDQMMMFGGSKEPCAMVDITCIGKLGLPENKSHTALVTPFMKEKLGIESDRFYISFHDAKAQDFGYAGTTFA